MARQSKAQIPDVWDIPSDSYDRCTRDGYRPVIVGGCLILTLVQNRAAAEYIANGTTLLERQIRLGSLEDRPVINMPAYVIAYPGDPAVGTAP